MSGAYVAKPDAVPESTAPPGWNPLWPWPGLFPPGFEWPDYEWPGLPGGGTPRDDETPRILVYPVTGLTTRESDDGTPVGTNNNLFYVLLTAKPTEGAITVPVASLDTSEGITRDQFGLGTELEFDTENWDVPQAVDLAGIKDSIEDGDVEYTVEVGPSESNNVDYNGLYGSDVSVTNIETVWQLRVTAILTTSTTIGVPLVWPTGYSSAVGWYRVAGPGTSPGGGNWAKSETTDYNYYHPTEAYHTVTEAITGSPESFDAFTKTYTLSHTGIESRYWRITFSVIASGQNSQWPFGGNWYNTAKSTMVIYAELLRDGVVQSTDTETISAGITMPGDEGGFGSALDINSGSMNFLTAEL